MKRWPIIVARTVGAVVGFFGTFYIGMAVNLGTSLTTTATVVLTIVCPVIRAICGSGGSFSSSMACCTAALHL
jgi:hypothetical protein